MSSTSPKKTIESCGGMEEYLEATNSASWKKFHGNRTCYEAYIEIKKNLEGIQTTVVTGAMNASIQEALQKYKSELDTINHEPDETIRNQKIRELFASDPIVFLNDHGPEHIEKVIERANAIILTSKNAQLSEFEIFILLTAIQIHDIGNILGRTGHERKLAEIFDDKCNNIIVDAPERRLIKSVAMAHGGKNRSGDKNTISLLLQSEKLFNSPVRTRLLAAILRLADELADDCSRANREALDMKILGTNSEIYHCYSRVLHTVSIDFDEPNNDYKISLVYEIETKQLQEVYCVGGTSKFLLDEIYDRTIKMELERRYCMKFMHPYINLGRIDVKINIYGKMSERLKTISYTLEDVLYPESPIVNGIQKMNINVPSGEELLNSLIERGEIDE